MRWITLCALAVVATFGAAPAEARELRVCADPDNLPFSNREGQGFENKIAEALARSLGAEISYTWWAQRRGFARNTLRSDLCDLWPGVASGIETLATTRPYYRSTYVFVTRADRHLHIASFDDPQLRRLAIGVQIIGYDAQNTPPAHALARRGIVNNVRGFLVYGDPADQHPHATIIDAVANGDIDLAVAWGPLAAYYAYRKGGLEITPVEPVSDGPQWPMVFDISMGVRRGEASFKGEIDRALIANQAVIGAILASFHVPVIGD